MKLLKLFVLALSVAASSCAFGQGLSWSSPINSGGSAPEPGGVSGRPGIAGVYFQGKVWGAVTRTGSFPEVQMINNGGGNGATFFSNTAVILGGNVYALSNVNPALTADGNNRIFLAFTDQNGINYIVSSGDGMDWTSGPAINTASGLPAQTNYSPSLAWDASTQTLYAAYANGQTFTPIVCAWQPYVSSTPSCQQYFGYNQENFSPSIAFWGGTLYLGYEDRGNSHCLWFYKYFPSSPTTLTNWQPISCNEQTSSAPSLAVHNNQLYVAFRTNDSNAKFKFRVSPDGNSLNFSQEPGFKMDGNPQFVEINDPSLFINSLMNIYARASGVNATVGN